MSGEPDYITEIKYMVLQHLASRGFDLMPTIPHPPPGEYDVYAQSPDGRIYGVLFCTGYLFTMKELAAGEEPKKGPEES